jgi:hypothetical protein
MFGLLAKATNATAPLIAQRAGPAVVAMSNLLANKGLPLGASAIFSPGVAAGIQRDNKQRSETRREPMRPIRFEKKTNVSATAN